MPKTIALDALTVEDLLNIGESGVTDRLPKSLLLTIARLYVHDKVRQRQRQNALSAERRAYRLAVGTPLNEHDGIDAMILAAATSAAAAVSFDWRPLLDVHFLVPSVERTTTWGLATIDEHRDRAEWLERFSAGSLRTAVQHRSAIDDLHNAGAERLRQIVERQS